jgi:hypothetical protein
VSGAKQVTVPRELLEDVVAALCAANRYGAGNWSDLVEQIEEHTAGVKACNFPDCFCDGPMDERCKNNRAAGPKESTC